MAFERHKYRRSGRRLGNILLAVLVTSPACTALRPSSRRARLPPSGTPRLVLLVVVDQLRADYLLRVDGLLKGGFRRLLDEGLRFTEAHQDQAITYTAPGHATISTGCHPSRHGIISNYWIDPETGEEVYAVEDDEPTRLECTGLGDWLKRRYRRAKVFAAGGKDRSAILLGGHQPDGAFWYDWEGGFETSDYYRRAAPKWLRAFNDKNLLAHHFGTAWVPIPIAEERLEELGVIPFELGPLHPGFPHVFGGPSAFPGESFYDALFDSPWLDVHVARLAERLIEAEGLGEDEVPDLLALAFSALDPVGHQHGPDSREVLDVVLRLDRTLEELFRFIDKRIGLEHVLVALTSDHGTAELPEQRSIRELPGKRIGAEEVLCVQKLETGLDERISPADWLLPGPALDDAAVAASGVARSTVERTVAEILEECPSVARVWAREDLVAGGGAPEPFRNAFYGERSPDFLIQWEEHFLRTRRVAATHGSSYGYDSWVPLMILGKTVPRGEVEKRVRTVDLAPTLAELLDVPIPQPIDGTSLSELVFSSSE